ncbi:hypothetical protein [Roseivirga sp.]|uniref:hypothetical protein n=1 Tax=Roseivirga sp. TaxID=1964215 RepID=UPI003B8AFFAE
MSTDFEKLIVAKKYINALKDEIGHLKGDIAERNAKIKALQFELTQKKKLSPTEKLELRTNEEIERLSKRNKKLTADLKQSKADRDRLLYKLNEDKS